MANRGEVNHKALSTSSVDQLIPVVAAIEVNANKSESEVLQLALFAVDNEVVPEDYLG